MFTCDSTIAIDVSNDNWICSLNNYYLRFRSNKEIPLRDYSNSLKQHRKATTIAKTDPRNEFGRIIEDSINCADPEYFSQTFQYLLHADCRMDLVHFERKPTNPQYADQMMTLYANDTTPIVHHSVEGCSNIIDHFIGSIITIPDGIFLAHKTKMFLRPNNSCCLVMKFSYSGNKMFQTTLPCLFQHDEATAAAFDHVENVEHQDGPLMVSSLYQSAGSTDVEVSQEEEEFYEGSTKNDARKKKHSITFLETTKASKYDHRKRQKKFTIGEFIGMQYTDATPCLPELSAEPISHPTSTSTTTSAYYSSMRTASASTEDDAEQIDDDISSVTRELVTDPDALDQLLEELSQATTSSSSAISSQESFSSSASSSSDFLASSLSTISPNKVETTSTKFSSSAISLSDEDSSTTLHSVTAMKTTRSIPWQGTPVNIQGMMRWTINGLNQITHIQCTRLTHL